MNDASDPADEPQVFYSSKPRLFHMALNIAIAPVLLYLLGVWPWPPLLPHYIVFAITTLMALRFATSSTEFELRLQGVASSSDSSWDSFEKDRKKEAAADAAAGSKTVPGEPDGIERF